MLKIKNVLDSRLRENDKGMRDKEGEEMTKLFRLSPPRRRGSMLKIKNVMDSRLLA